jgi:flagellar biosynthesis protein FliR
VSGIPLPGADQLETFLLVLIRCLTFFAAGPLFSDRKIPTPVKALAATATALALFPTLAGHGWVTERSLLGYAVLVGKEVLLGAALGLVSSFVFMGVRMAGSLLGIQMGFSIANVYDPSSSSEVSLIGQMQELLAVYLFLLADGHHLLLRALSFSLEKVPPGAAVHVAGMVGTIVPMASMMFLTTIQVGAPVLGALFLTDAALGFVARAVPQMNVFIVGIPVKIGVGIVLLVVTAPLFARLLSLQFAQMDRQVLALLGGM